MLSVLSKITIDSFKAFNMYIFFIYLFYLYMIKFLHVVINNFLLLHCFWKSWLEIEDKNNFWNDVYNQWMKNNYACFLKTNDNFIIKYKYLICYYFNNWNNTAINQNNYFITISIIKIIIFSIKLITLLLFQ